MGIIELSTKRPVAISMLTLAVLLFGMVSLSRLEVTLLPELSYPTLTVRTELPGAAPTELETLLSKPIEEALGVIKNVRQVRSVSRAGQSDVTLEFNWGTEMDYAVLDVREKLDALILPKESVRPIVLRFDPSQDPIVRLGLALKRPEPAAGEDKDKPVAATIIKAIAPDESALKRLRRIADEQVRKLLEGVPGVAAVKISGGLEDEIQVLVDLRKLAQLNLTLEQVAARLQAENANISGGRVDEGSASYLVRTLNQFTSLDEIRDTIISTPAAAPGASAGDLKSFSMTPAATVSGAGPGSGSVSGSGASRSIYVRDVALVQAGHKEREAIIRIDGEEAVEIALYKEGDGNTVTVAEGALKRIEQIKKQMPKDLELKPLYDQSVFIGQAISEVTRAAIEGGLLAVLVLYLFLRNAWTTAVVSLAIPISIIATFNIMYGAGASLNIMSLGGIALAMGLLVDDAIVVLENITRKHEQGMPLQQAAVVGSQEVVGAVTASTLTTVAVFFPMVFVEGIAGQLFADQALVVTGSLMFSLIVSFTVTPMLVSRGAKKEPIRPATPIVHTNWRERLQQPARWQKNQTLPQWSKTHIPAYTMFRQGLSYFRWGVLEVAPMWITRVVVYVAGAVVWAFSKLMRPLAGGWQRGYKALEDRYVPVLEWSLDHRGKVLAAAAGMFGLSLLLLTRIGVELLPPFNQGEFKAEVTLSPGTPLERTDGVIRELSQSLKGNEWLSANYSVAGTGNRLDANADTGGENYGVLNLALKPEAYVREAEVMDLLRVKLDALPGATYAFTRPALFTLKTPLEVEIAAYDLESLARVSEILRTRLLASDRFTEVETTLAPGHPEIQIEFDQERAAALGLNTADLAQRVARSVQGNVATRYRLLDRELDVLVRVTESERASVDAVKNLVINPASERPLTLAAVADVQLRTGPSEIRRVDQQRVVTLSANLVYGDLGDGVAELERIIAATPLPQGLVAQVAGQSEEMEVSFRSLQLALALAVFLVYLVMASEFESLIHPFVILFTIPLAAIGAILALYVTGSVINVIALIGMIVLAGIVVKNGIVLIDLVNRFREEGKPRREALLEGARYRLRPILMTTLTAVLGLLPMAIGAGEGAEVRAPMAITVIGGLLVSTLLTLVVIPVVYTLLDRHVFPQDRNDPSMEPALQK